MRENFWLFFTLEAQGKEKRVKGLAASDNTFLLLRRIIWIFFWLQQPVRWRRAQRKTHRPVRWNTDQKEDLPLAAHYRDVQITGCSFSTCWFLPRGHDQKEPKKWKIPPLSVLVRPDFGKHREMYSEDEHTLNIHHNLPLLCLLLHPSLTSCRWPTLPPFCLFGPHLATLRCVFSLIARFL